MNVLFLAATLVAFSAPCVANAQSDLERRTVRIEADSPGGGAPATTPRATPATPSPTSAAAAEREAAEAARPVAERRRGGKRIPDAELIGPRGAL